MFLLVRPPALGHDVPDRSWLPSGRCVLRIATWKSTILDEPVPDRFAAGDLERPRCLGV